MRAQLAEAAGERSDAVALYAEAAGRRRDLGQAGAGVPLAEAPALVASIGSTRAADECEAPLQRTAAASAS